jgi:hypothetical protein
MEPLTLRSWSCFALAITGSLYVLMTGSLAVHEILGHGLAAVLDGSPGMVFRVNPGFSGTGGGTGTPSPSGEWVIRFAGIGVNTVVGLLALVLQRRRQAGLTPLGLLLFWVATTQLGHALGYTLQGLLFFHGDAGGLPLLIGRVWRVVGVVVLSSLFVLLARWALSTAAGFVRDHFQPASPAGFRRDFLLGFTLPMAVLVLVAPGFPERDLSTTLIFDGGVLAVLLGVSVWALRRLPSEAEPKGRPIPARVALAWTAGALATFAICSLWLTRGVTVVLRPG